MIAAAPQISDDGRIISFQAVVRPGGLGPATVVRDLSSGENRVAAPAGQDINLFVPAPVSGDGRLVAFGSNLGALVPDDANSVSDVFVHDLTNAG